MSPCETMHKTQLVCYVCGSDEVNDLELGEFKTNNQISVHYFCLLLTSGLAQNGDDDEGILGFLPEDIRHEVDRIKRLKCAYCKKMKANIGCCDPKCRRTFHTRCGISNNCLTQFEDPFPSYCHQHVALGSDDASRLSKRKKHTAKEMCTICYEMMGPFHQVNSVLSPCCKTHWFHKRCLMEFAKNAGYFFKCPMCNNEDTFRSAVKLRGIFVPDTDAAWETEPNAFAELLEVPDTCEAIVCVCPEGRDYENTQYTLIRCDTCGSHCVHNKCLLTKEPFTCSACVLPAPLPDAANPEPVSDQVVVVEDAVEEATAIAIDVNSSDTESDDYPLNQLNYLTVKWGNILPTKSKRIQQHEPETPNKLANVKNTSSSDVEFVETKDEVLCISDDEGGHNASSVSTHREVGRRTKRILDESPPILPPNKKVRRALETMRNQSKITSFFSQLGKGVLGITGSSRAPDTSGVKIEGNTRIKLEPGLP